MLARSDNRVTVIHKKNGGLSDARNAGLDRATGELIGFVDSDDYIDRRMIETLYQDLAAFDADVACCNYDFCDEQSQIIKEHAAAVTATAVYDAAAALDRMLLEEYYKCYAWNKLYNGSCFSRSGIRRADCLKTFPPPIRFSGRSSGSPSIRRACITTVSGQALSRQGSFSRKPMI